MQSSSGSMSTTITRHIPVLLQEVLTVLDIEETDIVLDGTVGGGGHLASFATRLGKKGVLVGCDLDAEALKRSSKRIEGTTTACVVFIHDNFKNIATHMRTHQIPPFTKALFDLGWSSDQLESSGRGFSFNHEEPLHMTLADSIEDDTLTAEDIVNTWAEESLADILYGWGGERRARRIARAIVTARTLSPIITTKQLADIIERVVPRRGKVHPATKTFQALRIAVNDELGALTKLFEVLPSIVAKEARIAFLTFHSLEDRIVKNTFRTWAREGMGTIVTKKPITASREEVGHNPRSRSAKLRAFSFTHYDQNNF